MHILYLFTILLSLFDSHSNLEEIRARLVLVLIQVSAEIVVCNNLLWLLTIFSIKTSHNMRYFAGLFGDSVYF